MMADTTSTRLHLVRHGDNIKGSVFELSAVGLDEARAVRDRIDGDPKYAIVAGRGRFATTAALALYPRTPARDIDHTVRQMIYTGEIIVDHSIEYKRTSANPEFSHALTRSFEEARVIEFIIRDSDGYLPGDISTFSTMSSAMARVIGSASNDAIVCCRENFIVSFRAMLTLKALGEDALSDYLCAYTSVFGRDDPESRQNVVAIESCASGVVLTDSFGQVSLGKDGLDLMIGDE